MVEWDFNRDITFKLPVAVKCSLPRAAGLGAGVFHPPLEGSPRSTAIDDRSNGVSSSTHYASAHLLMVVGNGRGRFWGCVVTEHDNFVRSDKARFDPKNRRR